MQSSSAVRVHDPVEDEREEEESDEVEEFVVYVGAELET